MRKKKAMILFLLGIAFSLQAQTIEDYFRIAAENNPGLKAKYKQFEASLQDIPQMGALADPNLSFGYFISPVETRVGPQRAKISLTQMFPWFGTLTAKKNAAALMAEARYQEFLDTRNQLYYQVSAAYFPLYELQKWIDIERENIDILRSFKDITTKKFETGKGSMVDIIRIDIMLNESLSTLDILLVKGKSLKTSFNNLLNRNENDTIIVHDAEVVEVPLDYRRDSLLVSNPLIDELDLKIAASNASEEVAVKEGFPKIGAGLDYVIVGERTDMSLNDNGKDIFMPMVSVSLPIFRKKYKAAQKEEQLIRESLEFKKEDLINTLSGTYENTVFEINKQSQLVDLYNEQIVELERSLRLLYTDYGNSGEDFEELLRMRQKLLEYNKKKVTAVKEFQIALAKLDYLTAKNR